MRRLLRRPAAAVAAVVVALLVVGTLGAPLFAPYAPTTLDFEHLFAPPSREHLFGTDELGRDLLTRILYGGRTSIDRSAFAATAIAMVVGVAWGFAAALREGWLGEILMRVADTLMAMPAILLGLVLVAAFGASTPSMVVILGHPLRAGDGADRPLDAARRAALRVLPRRGLRRRVGQADRRARAAPERAAGARLARHASSSPR